MEIDENLRYTFLQYEAVPRSDEIKVVNRPPDYFL